MTRIQFGWSLPSGPPQGMSRNAYMDGVQKGFLTPSGLLTIYNLIIILSSKGGQL